MTLPAQQSINNNITYDSSDNATVNNAEPNLDVAAIEQQVREDAAKLDGILKTVNSQTKVLSDSLAQKQAALELIASIHRIEPILQGLQKSLVTTRQDIAAKEAELEKIRLEELQLQEALANGGKRKPNNLPANNAKVATTTTTTEPPIAAPMSEGIANVEQQSAAGAYPQTQEVETSKENNNPTITGPEVVSNGNPAQSEQIPVNNLDNNSVAEIVPDNWDWSNPAETIPNTTTNNNNAPTSSQSTWAETQSNQVTTAAIADNQPNFVTQNLESQPTATTVNNNNNTGERKRPPRPASNPNNGTATTVRKRPSPQSNGAANTNTALAVVLSSGNNNGASNQIRRAAPRPQSQSAINNSSRNPTNVAVQQPIAEATNTMPPTTAVKAITPLTIVKIVLFVLVVVALISILLFKFVFAAAATSQLPAAATVGKTEANAIVVSTTTATDATTTDIPLATATAMPQDDGLVDLVVTTSTTTTATTNAIDTTIDANQLATTTVATTNDVTNTVATATTIPAPTPTPTSYPNPQKVALTRIGVNTAVEPAAIVPVPGSKTALERQIPAHAAGHHTDSPDCGQEGVSIIAGHNYWGGEGVFYALHDARPGDIISCTASSGTVYHYQVLSLTQYTPDDTSWYHLPTADNSTFGIKNHYLILYTCTSDFKNRIAVLAKQLSN